MIKPISLIGYYCSCSWVLAEVVDIQEFHQVLKLVIRKNKSNLPGVYTGFAVLTTTPSEEQARHSMKYSGQFVANIIIASPFLYFIFTKALATLIEDSLSCAAVYVRFVRWST